jgi:SAM-dependent methyltransferase
VISYNKLCELEDFADPILSRYMREIFSCFVAESPSFPTGYEVRKAWEVAQAARTLTDFGATHSEAEILGVAAGTEQTIFWATNHVRYVFATDLYLDANGWEEASSSMLSEPGRHAEGPWNPRRLVVQHMDALDLRYEDESFEGVFCTSSIEHFGDEADVGRGVAEIWRVLKPRGIATISTEYRLSGPPPGLPGTLVFDGNQLDELIVKPHRWELVEPLQLEISERTLETPVGVSDFFAGRAPRAPHIVLEEQGISFTSVHLALRKQG